MTTLHEGLIREIKANLRENIVRIGNCANQLTDEQIWWRPHETMNSIGNLILHLAGNVRQWLIVGLSDLEDHRDRPAEFAEKGPIPRETLLTQLESTVEEACGVLDGLSESDLLAPRRIQGFDLDGVKAIFDCIPHFKGHTQEIICLTRMQVGEDYQYHWKPETPEQGA